MGCSTLQLTQEEKRALGQYSSLQVLNLQEYLYLMHCNQIENKRVVA